MKKTGKNLEWRTTHLRLIAKNWWESPAFFQEQMGIDSTNLSNMRAAILTKFPEFIELYAPTLCYLLEPNKASHENTGRN